MKTSNIAQKTESSISKTFVFLIGLFLIGSAAFAIGFPKPLPVNGNKAVAVTINQAKETGSLQAIAFIAPATLSLEATSTFYIEQARDKNLEIENWMTSETYFGSFDLTDQINKEETLKIENWMIESPYFAEPAVITENEPALNVEAWMTDESIWKN
jgi:hypothetical protein